MDASKSWRQGFWFFSFVFLFSCGGATGGGNTTNEGSVLPPVSLPAPTNGCTDSCVTVSSPNPSGLVTIAGSEGSVPASAVVLVEIGEATSQNLLKEFLNVIVPSAHAGSVCPTAFPECNASFDSGTCHVIADADGSFSVRVKAKEDERIRISYLDSANDCRDTEKLEGTIDDTFIPLDIEGSLLIVRDRDSVIEVFGTNADSDFKRVAFNSTTLDYQSTSDLWITENPLSATWLDSGEGETFHLLATASEVSLGNIDDARFAPLTARDSVNNRAFKSKHLKPYLAYPYPTLQACGDISDALSAQALDRVVAARDFDPATAPADGTGYPIAFIEGLPATPASLTVRLIQYYFSDYDSALDHAALREVIDLFVLNGVGLFLASFELRDGSTAHYLFEIPLLDNNKSGVGDPLCRGTVHPLHYGNLFFLRLPARLSSPLAIQSGTVAEVRNGEGVKMGLAGVVFIVNEGEANSVFAVPVANGVFDDTGDYLADTFLSGFDHLLPMNPAAGSTFLVGIGSTGRLAQLHFDEGNIGSGHSVFSEQDNELIVGAHPVDMAYVGGTDRIVVLSQGVKDDGFSLMRVISADDL